MRLELNRPVETTTPKLVVDAGLSVGVHRIRLVVVDASGLRSQPTEVVVRIVDTRPGSSRDDVNGE